MDFDVPLPRKPYVSLSSVEESFSDLCVWVTKEKMRENIMYKVVIVELTMRLPLHSL